MLSRQEIKQIFKHEYDAITARLVEANRNGEAHYTAHQAIKEGTLFLSQNPHLQSLEIQAARYYKIWERAKIQPTTRLNADGQMELGFGYVPNAVIVYGKNERGFMSDMTPKDTLSRMRLLQTSLKHTTDGIHAELTFYTESLQEWDQQKQKTMDALQKEVFGWKPSDESDDREEDSEDDEM